jgi:type II secretory pathway pseudopilin PulG
MTGRHRSSNFRLRSNGFSVIELVVVIGAIAIITVGVAQIFQSVGETVAGGRRVSGFTQAAARLESQLRQDISQMTRDGFLVIRHQSSQPVYLAPGVDVNSDRQRRIDELMFFATGQFTTSRPQVRPLNQPERVATSSHARIYYGHGSRDFIDESDYATPEVSAGSITNRSDDSESLLGLPGGPNEFASDWTLLRQATLLVEPQYNPDVSDPNAQDSEYQIAYQPAAGHIVKALAFRGDLTPAATPQLTLFSVGEPAPDERPALGSGIVDIATTSLEEIRAIVNDVGVHPRDILSGDNTPLTAPTGSPALLDGSYDETDLPFMHAWMRDALPAYSGSLMGDGPAILERVRTELVPPDFIDSAAAITANDTGLFSIELGNQVSLTAGAILPRCTEFIVEWSFGQVRQSGPGAGQLIWYGGSTATDFNPYTGTNTGSALNDYQLNFVRVDGIIDQHPVEQRLIHDAESLNNPNELGSFFGFTDPTFQPTANDPATIPWAWPRLLRVTASFADDTDPTREETFQFVFEVPQ